MITSDEDVAEDATFYERLDEIAHAPAGSPQGGQFVAGKGGGGAAAKESQTASRAADKATANSKGSSAPTHDVAAKAHGVAAAKAHAAGDPQQAHFHEAMKSNHEQTAARIRGGQATDRLRGAVGGRSNPSRRY